MLSKIGYEITGIDPSTDGIKIAKEAYPYLNLFEDDAYNNLAQKYGKFPIVISLEVIEHCFFPRRFAKTFFDLLSDNGVGILSTPYHGYLKNLAIVLTGKMDSHFCPLWDGGHVKYFSEATLRILLLETGFTHVTFIRVGRIPVLAKSIIAVVRK